MAALHRVIISIFDGIHGNHYANARSTDIPVTQKPLCLEVPVKEASFELPCFVATSVSSIPFYRIGFNTIVVSLDTRNCVPEYSSLTAYMKEVLLSNLGLSRLIRITTEQQGSPKSYYATYGAIFDDTFHPLLMCSRQMRIADRNGEPYLIKGKPIIRVNADCFMRKSNPIERFISGKFLQTALECRNRYSYISDLSIEIGDFPFHLKSISTPSISTSNEELLQVAKNNINEVMGYVD